MDYIRLTLIFFSLICFFVTSVNTKVYISGLFFTSSTSSIKLNSRYSLPFSQDIVYIFGGDCITGITDDAILYGFAKNSNSLFAKRESYLDSPTRYPSEEKFSKVVSTSNNMLALTTQGTLIASGKSDVGEIGLPPSEYSNPEIVPLPSNNTIVDISTAKEHAVILDARGRVYTAGSGSYYKLCSESTEDRHSFSEIVTNNIFSFITASAYGTLLIDQNGKVHGCGSNSFGELGMGSLWVANSVTPMIESEDIQEKFIVQVSSFLENTYLLDSNGQVYFTGKSFNFESGTGENLKYATPVQISNFGSLQDQKIIQIVALFSAAIALDEHGEVHYWGTGFSQAAGTTAPTILPISTFHKASEYISGGNGNSILSITESGCEEGYIKNGTYCLSCPEGYYCPTGFLKHTCPIGMWSAISSSSVLDCKPELCPPGNECMFGKIIKCISGTACLNGKKAICTGNLYSSNDEQSTCSICNNGEYTIPSADTGNVDCVTCPAGSICNGYRRTPCTGSSYSSFLGQHICEVCEPGFYTFGTLESGNIWCNICPPGNICPDGFSVIPCIDSEYTDIVGGTQCKSCQHGFYTIENGSGQGNIECRICPKGAYCDGENMRICQGSNFTMNEGSSHCDLCPIGSYINQTASNNGNIGCSLCPEGYECPDGVSKHVCSNNLFSKAGMIKCTLCPPGNYTVFSSSGEGNIACVACPPGSYCDGTNMYYCQGNLYSNSYNSKNCTICPLGGHTIPSFDKLGNIDCFQCPIGAYCDGAEIRPCQGQNYSSSSGSPSCQVCNPGNYTVSNEEGNVECRICPAGYECRDGITLVQCLNSFYSGVGEQNCKICPPGNYTTSSELGDGNVECTNCPIGAYCDGHTIHLCKGSNFTSTKGSYQCEKCPVGKYISNLSVNGGNIACTECPEGFECPDGISTQVCSKNLYSGVGASSCNICPPGSFTRSTALGGNNNCSTCPKGAYCDGENMRICQGSNFTMNEGSSHCDLCPIGSYINQTASNNGNIGCSLCPEGYECPDGVSKHVCSNNHYSHSGESRCIKCPPGSYTIRSSFDSNSGNNDCILCPIGAFCDGENLYLCQGHHFAPSEGATYCDECPLGSFINQTSNTGGNVGCQVCPEGYECPNGIYKSVCSDNLYSGKGESRCKVCPPGNYTVQSLESDGNSNCDICPAGKCCPLGNSIVETCGASDSIASDVKLRTTCPPGSYGHEDHEGNIVCWMCPIGSYCPGNGSMIACINNNYTEKLGSIICEECTPGYYTVGNGFGNTFCAPCPVGWYCEDGNQRILCSLGTTTNTTGSSDSTFCSALHCSGEHPCNIEHADDSQKLSSPGFFPQESIGIIILGGVIVCILCSICTCCTITAPLLSCFFLHLLKVYIRKITKEIQPARIASEVKEKRPINPEEPTLKPSRSFISEESITISTYPLSNTASKSFSTPSIAVPSIIVPAKSFTMNQNGEVCQSDKQVESPIQQTLNEYFVNFQSCVQYEDTSPKNCFPFSRN